MAGFNKTEVLVKTSDGRNMRFYEPVDYVDKNGNTYTIPIGATTDGASTPAALWLSIPPFGKYWLAAAFHDWLYRQTTFDKELCDSLLREAMLSLGVDKLRADEIYEGVKLFGFGAFRSDRVNETN